jgi:hypothetical protein
MEGGEKKKKKRERETATGEENFLGPDLICWLCHGS